MEGNRTRWRKNGRSEGQPDAVKGNRTKGARNAVTARELENWRKEIEADLTGNILPFWIRHAPDRERGGFIGEIDDALTRHPEADKGLVLNARILWTFAAAHRIYREPAYKAMADEAYRYLLEHFRDGEFGGYYWMLDGSGAPVRLKKQVYGQAFVIYALSEYVRMEPHAAALEEAVHLFRLLEQHSHDPVHGGYVEALARDWRETGDLSLSSKDLNEKKSMNTHLHVMESYTNLYRVWRSALLRKRLGELIDVTLNHILDERKEHFRLFFTEAWDVRSPAISYGHDIEGSWLLVEAAETLGDPARLARAQEAAIRMADAVLAEGLDEDGGLVYEAGPDGWTETNKDWWPQAEAVVGWLNAYRLTGRDAYLEAAMRVWRFIDRHIIDKEHGEWRWGVDRSGRPLAGRKKVDAWKCPYHNARMGFEATERLAQLIARA